MALHVAERLNGVIINADASQVYADLRVLSARPDDADLARAPHRLYGVLDGSTACTAAMWAEMARAEIRAAWDAGCLPLLVGGTGLYLRTLLDGIAPVPEIEESVRAEVRALDVADAYAALRAADPAMAARLKPADRQRIARALEVVRATGRSLLDWQQETRGGLADAVDLRAFVVEVERPALYARCDARFEQMLAEGALDEVVRLTARRLPSDLPVMKALGVPPLAHYLSGTVSLQQATDMAQQDTRRYAKRQTTWFRHQCAGWTKLGSHDFDKAISAIVTKFPG